MRNTLGLARVTGLELDAYRPEHVEARIGRALRREGAVDVTSLAVASGPRR